MSDKTIRSDIDHADLSPDSESQLAQIMNEYLEMLEDGRQPSRQQLLAKHPQLAEQLGQCLDGIDLLHMADNDVRSGDDHEAHDIIQPLATLGDFRIVRQIARGGMGIVYEAEQLSIGRRVALKILPFAALLHGGQLQRFRNEARTAGTLHHPNIVPVYSVGTERGVHYYAMHLVDGPSLAEVLNDLKKSSGVDLPEANGFPADPRGDSEKSYAHISDTQRELQAQLSTKWSNSRIDYFRIVAQWGHQAAIALDYAHDNGVMHRDIKPGNLLLDESGKILVTDFGLARLQGDASVTMTGDILGTLRYMAPEQALAKRILVDHRADVYSLGVTLYELVAGRPAFTGSDREEVLRKVAFEEPQRPSKLDASIPRDLETIVLKAASKAPEERYQTMKEFGDDLSRFLRHQPINARPPSLADHVRKWTRRHRGIAWTAGAGLILVAVTSAISSYWTAKTNHRLALAVADAERAVVGERVALQAARKQFYLSAMRQAHADLRAGDTARFNESMMQFIPKQTADDLRNWEWYYLLTLFRQESKVLYEHAAAVREVAWNPERRVLATAGGDGVRIWNSESWKVDIAIGPHSANSVAWHPHGNLLAVSGGDAAGDWKVSLWDIDSGVIVREITKSDEFSSLAFSSDGQYLAATIGGNTWKVWNVEAFEEAWSREVDDAIRVSWHPRENWLACATRASQETTVLVADIPNDRLVGNVEDFERGILDVSWSPTGNRLAVLEGHHAIKMFDGTSFERLAEVDVNAVVERIGWSPDGELLAAGIGRDVLVYNKQLLEPIRLSGHSGQVLSIAWIDGETLASGSTDRTARIWRVDNRGNSLGARTVCSEIAEWTDTGTGYADKAFFSNSGRFVAILDHATSELVVRRVVDGFVTHRFSLELADSTGCVAWSPGDEWVACPTSQDRVVELFNVIDGSREILDRVSEGEIKSLDWSPVGPELAAAIKLDGKRKGHVRIWSTETGESVRTLGVEQSPVISVAWDPSGTRLASVENAGRTCLVRLWNTSDGSLLKILTGHQQHKGVIRPKWSHDGRRLAAFGWRGTIPIWDVASGAIHCRLRGHSSAASGVWHPNDDRFLSRGDDGTVRLWDVLSGEEILRLIADYRAITFSVDGSQVHLLGKTLDTIRVSLEEHESRSDLLERSLLGMLANGDIDQADLMVQQLDVGHQDRPYLQRQLFHERYFAAIAIDSAVEESAISHLEKLLTIWIEILDRQSSSSIREFGASTSQRITLLLLQAADLSVVRAEEYGQDVRPFLSVMEKIIRSVDEYLSESRIPSDDWDLISRRRDLTKNHLQEMKDALTEQSD